MFLFLSIHTFECRLVPSIVGSAGDIKVNKIKKNKKSTTPMELFLFVCFLSFFGVRDMMNEINN